MILAKAGSRVKNFDRLQSNASASGRHPARADTGETPMLRAADFHIFPLNFLELVAKIIVGFHI
jgi:hypothetical protein